MSPFLNIKINIIDNLSSDKNWVLCTIAPITGKHLTILTDLFDLSLGDTYKIAKQPTRLIQGSYSTMESLRYILAKQGVICVVERR